MFKMDEGDIRMFKMTMLCSDPSWIEVRYECPRWMKERYECLRWPCYTAIHLGLRRGTSVHSGRAI